MSIFKKKQCVCEWPYFAQKLHQISPAAI